LEMSWSSLNWKNLFRKNDLGRGEWVDSAKRRALGKELNSTGNYQKGHRPPKKKTVKDKGLG